MFLTVFLTSIGVFLAILSAFYVTYRFVMPKITRTVTQFVTSPAENVASPLATIVESAARTAGRTIAIEVKTTLMGKASVSSRQEAGIIADIASDQLQNQSPMIAGLLDTMPTLKKRLLKNPGLMASIGSVLAGSGLTGVPGNNHSDSHSSVPIVKVNYGKYK